MNATLLALLDSRRPDRARSVPAARASPAGPASRLRRWADPAAVLAATALIAVRAAGLGRWIVDDAAVTFAYARSIDEGLGPVQLPGASPVEGYSNPAWLALMAVGRRLGLFDHGAFLGVSDLVLYPKALALLCTAGTLACVAWAARAVVPGRAWAVTLLAGAALATNLSYVAWSFSGLENPLYGLTAAGTGAVLVRAVARGGLTAPRTAVTAGAIALLAALARPDGAVLMAAYPLVLALSVRRDLARSVRALALHAGVVAVPYGAFLLWRHAVFGLWVPNTAVAKAQQTPELAQLAQTGALLTYAGWAFALIGALCAGAVLARPGTARRALVALLVPLLLSLLAYGVLGRDWMALYRFATPVWVLAAAVAALSAVVLWEAEGVRGRAVLVMALSGALVLAHTGQAAREASFKAHPTLSMCFVAERYGQVFNTYAERLGLRHATVALPDLGGTLLTTRLRVLDLAGLTDRRIADAYASGDMRALRDHVLRAERPELLHVHGAWVNKPGLTVARLADAGYVPLYRQQNGGDFVRADAVHDPARIAAVRAWAAPRLDHLIADQDHTGSCGATLTPGQGAAL
uniref:Glycosyltransferase RgtA/B/C/D-like domain-containing protein n=1 Tax=Streptomyces sp. NBC_00119 TaxID=2975659 RepID=A0AAU1UDM9_9ACTN